MSCPDCKYIVEGNFCSHYKNRKFFGIFNKTCMLSYSRKTCELQERYSKLNIIVQTQKLI